MISLIDFLIDCLFEMPTSEMNHYTISNFALEEFEETEFETEEETEFEEVY